MFPSKVIKMLVARVCARSSRWGVVAGAVMLVSQVSPLGHRAVAADTQRFVVIANSSSVPMRLDIDELQQVFLRRRLMWPSGARTIPLNFPAGDSTRADFDRVVLGLTPDRVAAYWIDARIRYGVDPPRTVTSAAIAVRIVARLPGGIAYVPANQVAPEVRVVARIEGGQVLPP